MSIDLAVFGQLHNATSTNLSMSKFKKTKNKKLHRFINYRYSPMQMMKCDDRHDRPIVYFLLGHAIIGLICSVNSQQPVCI